jgi:hypothetical protein
VSRFIFQKKVVKNIWRRKTGIEALSEPIGVRSTMKISVVIETAVLQE